MLTARLSCLLAAICLIVAGLLPAPAEAHADHRHEAVSIGSDAMPPAVVSDCHGDFRSGNGPSDAAAPEPGRHAGCCTANLACCGLPCLPTADLPDHPRVSRRIRAENWRAPAPRAPEAVPEPPRTDG
jgi:hypothetical protein